MNEIILQRIKEKLFKLIELDKDKENFGANGNVYGHDYIINPPVDIKKIRKFEKEINEKLPSQYFLFLTKICNGKAGPDYGLYPFEEAIETAIYYYNEYPSDLPVPDNKKCFSKFPITTKQVEKYIKEEIDYENYRIDDFNIDKLSGIVLLSNYIQGHDYILVVKGEQKGKVWLYSDARFLTPLYHNDTLKQYTFFDWYESWLDDSLNYITNQQIEKPEINYETDEELIFDNFNFDEIPKTVFENKNLKKLVLIRCKSQIDFDEVFKLKNLKMLDLSFNKLKKIPKNINNLENLVYLNISNNYDLTEIPDELGQLVKLKELNVSDTNLSVVQNDFCKLINLKYLNLSNTNINFLPEEFVNLTNLVEIEIKLETDFYYGKAFNLFSKLPKLRTLAIRMPKIIPQSVGLMQNLRKLIIAQNKTISDKTEIVFAKEFNQLILDYLYIDAKNIVLPKDLENLIYLKKLCLNNNSIHYFKHRLKELTYLKEVILPFNILESERKEIKEMLPNVFVH